MSAFMERKWKTIEGKPVEDMLTTFTDIISTPGKTVHVGTDSQQAGKFTQYVTVLVVLTPGKGGRAFYLTERVPRIKNLKERLMKEVWMSVSLGLELTAHMGEHVPMTVHIDANPDIKFKSSAYVKELTSMVVSQGFESLLKPDAWAAQHVADHTVKHRVLGL